MSEPRSACLAVVLLSVALGGCYEDSETTLHEPGDYKGQPDPLLERDAEQRAERMALRFRRVQSDR